MFHSTHVKCMFHMCGTCVTCYIENIHVYSKCQRLKKMGDERWKV